LIYDLAMKKKSKITITHFLNTKLKPFDDDLYPVYVMIWFQNKLTKIKSLWWVLTSGDVSPYDESEELTFNYMSKNQFEQSYYLEKFTEESKILEVIIRTYFEKFGVNVVTKQPSEIYKVSIVTAFQLMSLYLKNELQSNFALSNDIKVISARLMINWYELSFINIYDGLYSISKDGDVETAFYRDVLSKYNNDRELLQVLFDFEAGKKLRMINWISQDIIVAFKEELDKKGLMSTISDQFVNDLNSQIHAQGMVSAHLAGELGQKTLKSTVFKNLS